MKRLSVRIRESALSDIADIYRFVYERSRSADVADRFTTRIFDACERIGDAPFGGRRRDDLASGLRTFPFEKRAPTASSTTSSKSPTSSTAAATTRRCSRSRRKTGD